MSVESTGKPGPIIEIPSHRDALGGKLSELSTRERRPSQVGRFRPVINIAAVAVPVILVLISVLVPLHLVRPDQNSDVALKEESGGEQIAEERYDSPAMLNQLQSSVNGPDASLSVYGIRPVPTTPSIPLKEAEKKAGIKARLPKAEKITGEREGVYFEMSASENPQIVVHYGNGIMVANEVWKEKFDYVALLQADAKMLSGVSSQPGKLVEVAGHQGMLLSGTGYNNEPQAGICYVMPPQLEWWHDGVKFYISSWNFNFTEEQLLEIAESMY